MIPIDLLIVEDHLEEVGSVFHRDPALDRESFDLLERVQHYQVVGCRVVFELPRKLLEAESVVLVDLAVVLFFPLLLLLVFLFETFFEILF